MTKVFKKGEFLFREGEKSKSIYIVQSGSVSVYLQRPKQKIEMYTISNMQVLGEQLLNGMTTHSLNAVAVTETTVFEVPLEALKAQIESSPQLLKLLLKSLNDKLRVASAELKSVKLERDNSPCPPEMVPRVFACFYHTALLKGEKRPGKGPEAKPETLVVNWPNLKAYAQKVFLENPKRIEAVANILVKLKMASFEYVKNEDDPDAIEELGFIHLNNMVAIEQFYEFYQHFFYKPGKADFLKTDDVCTQLLTILMVCAKDETPDRRGAVRFSYPKLVDRFKNEFGMNLSSDTFATLERKGLLVNRQSLDTGIFLAIDFAEFSRTLVNWRFLREVEKWNERGFIDMSETEDPFRRQVIKTGEASCPECKETLVDKLIDKQKFCSNCGCKLTHAA